MHRSDEFRKAATDCVALARKTTDATTRINLLTTAQKWFDLANGSFATQNFERVLREFNEARMIQH